MTVRCERCGTLKQPGKCRECKRRYDLAYYEKNGERIRKRVNTQNAKDPIPNRNRVKAWVKAFPNKAKDIGRRWKEANPEQHRLLRRLHKQTRRARAFAGGVPDPQHLLVLLRQPRCTYCDTLFDAGVLLLTMSVDHVLPLARGGTNHSSNLVAVCRRCNASKGDRILYLEWLPLGLVRDRVFTKEEVEVYCREEAEKQRVAIKARPGLAASPVPDTSLVSERAREGSERLL